MLELDQIVHTLQRGGIIIYPTETIWGLGCDATSGKSVEKLHSVKKRPSTRPFTVLVNSLEMLHEYVVEVHPRLETLLLYHQRPLTVIYNQVRSLPKVLRSDRQSVAIRMTLDPFCSSVIDAFGKPIIATSANISEQPFPANFHQIDYQLLQQVDYVVKHKQESLSRQDPSVVVRMSDKAELEFLRT
ncbi:MAG: threonylcarbamoyl-AMP synthase [Saprospiraceae bacterium]|nr:threonylcarbamoyl-AMP synthase [Saprospiraceae bacterium]